MIDTKQLEDLKAKARAATPGPWFVQYGDDMNFMCMTAISADNSRTRNEGQFVDDAKLIAITYHQCYPGAGYETDDFGEADSTYIAAANPAAILSLIAELEQARKDAERRMQELIAAQSEVGRLDAKLFLAEEDAERYRALRNIHDEQLEIAGIPCIAVPQGPDMHGKRNGVMVNGADADKAADFLRSGKLVWKSDFDAALSAQEGEGK